MIDLHSMDQTPDQHYKLWQPALRDNVSAGYGVNWGGHDQPSIRFEQGTFDQQSSFPLFAGPSTGGLPESRTVTVHLAQVRTAIEKIEQSHTRAKRERRHQKSLQWLSRNRPQYAGQWVALLGNRLLATGKTAREVYSQVPGHQPPPLVVKIDAEDLPFGGW